MSSQAVYNFLADIGDKVLFQKREPGAIILGRRYKDMAWLWQRRSKMSPEERLALIERKLNVGKSKLETAQRNLALTRKKDRDEAREAVATNSPAKGRLLMRIAESERSATQYEKGMDFLQEWADAVEIVRAQGLVTQVMGEILPALKQVMPPDKAEELMEGLTTAQIQMRKTLDEMSASLPEVERTPEMLERARQVEAELRAEVEAQGIATPVPQKEQKLGQ